MVGRPEALAAVGLQEAVAAPAAQAGQAVPEASASASASALGLLFVVFPFVGGVDGLDETGAAGGAVTVTLTN